MASGPNFASLLSAPAGQAKMPEALPAGDYTVVVQRHQMGVSNQKKTPYVEFIVSPVAPPEDSDPADFEGIELQKKTFRVTFYLTPDSMWRLDQFLRDHLGLDMDGKSYEEILPETVGGQCKLRITQDPARDGSDRFVNVVGNTSAA